MSHDKNTGDYHQLPSHLGPWEEDPSARKDWSEGQIKKSQKTIHKTNLLPWVVLIFFALVSFGIGFALVFFGTTVLPESLEKLVGINNVKTEESLAGAMKVILVDNNYQLYNSEYDRWDPHSEKTLPVGIQIRTSIASSRNIFSFSHSHTFRLDSESVFQVDSYTPPGIEDPDNTESADTSGRVEITLSRGNLWIETDGDLFIVNTDSATVRSQGRDFQIRILDDGKAAIYAWEGPVQVTAVITGQRKNLEFKQIFTVDSTGNMTLSGIISRDPWQSWNRTISNKKILAGDIPRFSALDVPETVTKTPSQGGKIRAETPRHTSSPPPSYTPVPSIQAPPPSQPPPASPPPTGSAPLLGGDNPYPKATSAPRRNTYVQPAFTPAAPRHVQPTPVKMTPSYRHGINPAPRHIPSPSRHSPLQNPTPSRPNPLDNNPTMNQIPGMGLHDKPQSPPGGYGLP